MNRRGFLKKMGLGAVAVVATPVAVLAAKQVQPPKSGLSMLTDNDQYIRDALGKQMRDRLDEIAFSQMYNGKEIIS